jgi:CRISPR-associated protein Cmr5
MLLAGAGRQSEQDSAHRLVYKHLQDWLCQGNDAVYRDKSDLVEAVISHGQNDYVRAQGEALAYLDWLKKFAQAYLAGGED